MRRVIGEVVYGALKPRFWTALKMTLAHDNAAKISLYFYCVF